MIRFFRYITLTILISLGIATVLSYASLYSLRKSDFYKPSFVANNAHLNLDYAVLGSSTGLTTLNTQVIDQFSNKNGLNISIDDTSMNSHFLMLKHFIAQGGRINKLLMVVSPGDLANDYPQLSGNDYRFLPFIHTPYVSEYYGTFNSKQARLLSNSRYLPFLGMSFYNSELFFPSLKTMMQPQSRNRFDAKGNFVYPDKGQVLEKKLSVKTTNVKVSNPFFEKIRQLCKQHGIQLIVYQPPIYNKIVKAELDTIPFINHSNLFSDPLMFYDRIHVNGNGRFEASKRVGMLLNTL